MISPELLACFTDSLVVHHPVVIHNGTRTSCGIVMVKPGFNLGHFFYSYQLELFPGWGVLTRCKNCDWDEKGNPDEEPA